jgi:indole-3-glycerol phosphate synthase
MPSLDSIIAATRQRVERDRQTADVRTWERMAAAHTPRGFRKHLQSAARQGIAIIAELKKASPSKGLIRADFRPADLAQDLEQAGAAALSVLTDQEFFQGSLQNLQNASAATRLPCLRKDFIVDEIQILEARAHYADAILLIVAALEQNDLTALAHKARSLDLDVLCEVHDQPELQRALDAGCDLIGVNSRDLRTFHVDLDTAFRLAEKIPAECLPVAESGIHSGEDVARLKSAGYVGFLIGESLMREEYPGRALKILIEHAARVEFSARLVARSPL